MQGANTVMLKRVAAALLIGCIPQASAIASASASEQQHSPPVESQAHWLLTGLVRGPSGAPASGVTVSAKITGGPVIISVFTNTEGRYYFPPLPAGGRYVVAAQSAGYRRAVSELALSRGVNRVDLALQPTDDVMPQLSGWQQLAALPNDTREERRGKAVILKACSACHQTSRIFTRRFDEHGWSGMVDAMPYMLGGAEPAALEVFKTHRQEMVSYLAKVAGPAGASKKIRAAALRVAQSARPSGDALHAITYEYVLPNVEGRYPFSTGNDWSEGPPIAAGVGTSIHDATVDMNGDLWFSSTAPTDRRTIAKIDGRTGKTHSYAYAADQLGAAGRSHSIITAQDGTIWFSHAPGNIVITGHLGFMDPRTGDTRSYRVPAGMAAVGGWINEDGKGGIWSAAGAYRGAEGALRFDRKTKRFEQFKPISDGMTYGVAGDRDGNGWWAQINADIIGHVNRASGKVSEIHLPFTWEGASFLKSGDMSEDEYRRIHPGIGGGYGNSQMPRRMRADLRADVVWVANYAGNNLMRIDTKTRDIAFVRAPAVGMNLYDVGVDRAHRVWVGLQNGDEVARFDPNSNSWTLFPLPTRGVSARSLVVVERDGHEEIILPSNDAHKVVRLIPRTAAQAAAVVRRYYAKEL
jgi:streptogramin lyase